MTTRPRRWRLHALRTPTRSLPLVHGDGDGELPAGWCEDGAPVSARDAAGREIRGRFGGPWLVPEDMGEPVDVAVRHRGPFGIAHVRDLASAWSRTRRSAVRLALSRPLRDGVEARRLARSLRTDVSDDAWYVLAIARGPEDGERSCRLLRREGIRCVLLGEGAWNDAEHAALLAEVDPHAALARLRRELALLPVRILKTRGIEAAPYLRRRDGSWVRGDVGDGPGAVFRTGLPCLPFAASAVESVPADPAGDAPLPVGGPALAWLAAEDATMLEASATPPPGTPHVMWPWGRRGVFRWYGMTGSVTLAHPDGVPSVLPARDVDARIRDAVFVTPLLPVRVRDLDHMTSAVGVGAGGAFLCPTAGGWLSVGVWFGPFARRWGVIVPSAGLLRSAGGLLRVAEAIRRLVDADVRVAVVTDARTREALRLCGADVPEPMEDVLAQAWHEGTPVLPMFSTLREVPAGAAGS